MYQRALTGYEKALGPDHRSTLVTVNNLGNLCNNQGKLKEAQGMYQRALVGREKAQGPDHPCTLDTVNNLKPGGPGDVPPSIGRPRENTGSRSLMDLPYSQLQTGQTKL